MRRFSLIVACALVMSLVCSVVARAASVQHPWSIGTGPSIRISDEDSDFGYSSPWAAWLDYTFGDYSGLDWDVGGDYLWSTTDDNNTSDWGIRVGVRTAQQFYVLGDIGFDYLTDESSHISGLGGDVGFGYNFNKNPNANGGLYLEAKYRFLPERNGANNDSLGVGLGYRF